MKGLLMGVYRPECRGGNTPLTILLLWSWPRQLSSTCCTLKGTNWVSQYFELRLQFAWLWLWKCVLKRQCISRLVFHKLPDAFDVNLEFLYKYQVRHLFEWLGQSGTKEQEGCFLCSSYCGTLLPQSSLNTFVWTFQSPFSPAGCSHFSLTFYITPFKLLLLYSHYRNA